MEAKIKWSIGDIVGLKKKKKKGYERGVLWLTISNLEMLHFSLADLPTDLKTKQILFMHICSLSVVLSFGNGLPCSLFPLNLLHCSINNSVQT